MSSALSTNKTVSPNWTKEQKDSGGWNLNSGTAYMSICNFFLYFKKFRLCPQRSSQLIVEIQFTYFNYQRLFYILDFMTSDVTQPEIATEDDQDNPEFCTICCNYIFSS